jgi:tetratricopeptide (TPR) repeat protein
MMNKIQIGHQARASHYATVGEFKKAIEYYSKCTELPDVWRSLALAYSDIDDLENSISAFEKAAHNGDMKSVPWLVELLQAHRPHDPELPNLKRQLEEGVSSGNIDFIFSLGNLHLIGGEYEEALTFWSDYINLEHWLINRNIANILITRYLLLGHLIPAPLGPLETAEDAWKFFMDVNEKGFHAGEASALVDIGARFTQSAELDIFSSYSPVQFFDAYMDAAAKGHAESIIAAIYFANLYWDEIPDDSQLLQLVGEFGLTEFLEELDYRESSEELTAEYGAKFGTSSNQPDSVNPVGLIFERADAAQKSGDVFAEISAWIEGVGLGDENCFFNLGVALRRELGIVQNFFGSQGGEDKTWSALAKGIGASEHRPGRGPIHKMSMFLSANQLNNVRSTYGGRPTVQPESLNPGQESSIVKIRDLFEKCGFTYSLIDQNLIALPYGSDYGSFLILCELIEDEGKDLALIYTCLLTSKFDEDGNPIPGLSGVNKIQEKVLEILVRDQEVVFPGMMMMDIGTIFNSIPKEYEPTSFLNISKAKEYWSIIGASPATMYCEALPTKHEFEKVEFGYGVDIGLQSDHFETAIRAIMGSITGIVNVMSGMFEESEELFDLIFDYQTPTRFDNDVNIVEKSELAPLGSKIAQALLVYEEEDQNKRLEKLLELSAGGLRVARRVILDAVELTPSNIDVIAQTMLLETEIDENHPQLRDTLNSIGWRYREFGESEKALEFFEKAANLGSGNALANLNWQLLSTGEHEYARKIFDESYYRIMVTRETENDYEQGANIRSNDALHRMALGAPHSELREIWQDSHFQENHLESKFYPTLLDHIEGNTKEVSAGLSALTKSEISDLRETFRSLLDGHEWIAGIARTALEILGEEPQKKKGLFRR